MLSATVRFPIRLKAWKTKPISRRRRIARCFSLSALNGWRVQRHFARGRPVERAEQMEQCRFAASTGTDDRDEFALVDVEIDAVQGVDTSGETCDPVDLDQLSSATGIPPRPAPSRVVARRPGSSRHPPVTARRRIEQCGARSRFGASHQHYRCRSTATP